MVEILLSTYNGEQFLKEQLDSILSQDYKNWILKIRDDGSDDNTVDLITTYVEKYPDKIIFLRDNLGNIGGIKSFEILLNDTSSDYIMFCDQDDVWLKNKIAISLDKIKELESSFPSDPLLVFSDLCVVDSKLDIRYNSYFKAQKIFPEVCRNYIKTLALNVAPGCTMIFNKKCKEFVLPFNGLIHDYWMMGNISYYGHIDYVDSPTILYRQHDKNVIGANLVDSNYLLNRLVKPFKTFRILNSGLSKFKFPINHIKFWYYKFFFFFKRFM